ncbi:MAG TPA: PilZ domain-containing protein [Candidatus Acidoferrales bacterium]
MTDKRNTRRVPLVIRVEAHAGGSPRILLAQNISAGGILLRSADAVAEGATLDLKFTLPGVEREIRATARVQHVTPGEFVGAQFVDLNAADAEAIRRFVEKA